MINLSWLFPRQPRRCRQSEAKWLLILLINRPGIPGVDQPMVTRVRSSRGSPSCHPGLRADVSFLSTSWDGVRLVLTELTSGIKRVWTSRLNVCCHCEWDNDRGFTSWSRYILFFLSGALQQWLCRFKNKCVYPTPFIRVRTSALQTTDRLIITQNTFVNTPDMKMLKIKLKKKKIINKNSKIKKMRALNGEQDSRGSDWCMINGWYALYTN